MTDSRVSGFYRLSVAQRRAVLGRVTGWSEADLAKALEDGGLGLPIADKLVENVVGTYALPFGVAVNFTVNGQDCLVPMVVEEPSVIAAASNAARLVRSGGGFSAEVPEALMIGQIELVDVVDPEHAQANLAGAEAELIELATRAAPGLTPFGGGPRGIEVRSLGDRRLVLHVLVDCRDAMGANMINTIAEAVAPRAAEISGGRVGLRILSNLADRRRVRAWCRVPTSALASNGGPSGPEVAQAVEQASRFAEADPYRAVTHNKGIMNGVDAVVVATGNDFRAVEAGAHAYAAQSGAYRPLSSWRVEGGELTGTLELPLALGTVGGTLRAHPGARLALALLGVDGANQLAEVVASVGLATNLAALRALSTEGIQRGHMALHARSVAVTAGAVGTEVDRVAHGLVTGGLLTVARARELLAVERAEESRGPGENPAL
jgi:hydroxymethylglutaryl-CoA reductase